MVTDQQFQALIERVKQLETQKIYRQQIAPLEVKQTHIDGYIIFHGDVADRPSDGSTEIRAYYAEDEKKLYIWNTENDAWEYASFT